jgi:hypothetical protein
MTVKVAAWTKQDVNNATASNTTRARIIKPPRGNGARSYQGSRALARYRTLIQQERGKHPTQGFAVDTCLGQESAGASKNR